VWMIAARRCGRALAVALTAARNPARGVPSGNGTHGYQGENTAGPIDEGNPKDVTTKRPRGCANIPGAWLMSTTLKEEHDEQGNHARPTRRSQAPTILPNLRLTDTGANSRYVPTRNRGCNQQQCRAGGIAPDGWGGTEEGRSPSPRSKRLPDGPKDRAWPLAGPQAPHAHQR
jgi:hypothetical protein